MNQWLAAGTISVWVVDPPNQTVDVYRKDAQPLRYRAGDVLRDEPTLPGFELAVAELFNG